MTTTTDHIIDIYAVIVKTRPRERPKREIQLTDEEKKQRAREIAKRHYEQNYEYRILQKHVIINELNN